MCALILLSAFSALLASSRHADYERAGSVLVAPREFTKQQLDHERCGSRSCVLALTRSSRFGMHHEHMRRVIS